jgi:hypothetical protein
MVGDPRLVSVAETGPRPHPVDARSGLHCRHRPRPSTLSPLHLARRSAAPPLDPSKLLPLAPSEAQSSSNALTDQRPQGDRQRPIPWWLGTADAAAQLRQSVAVRRCRLPRCWVASAPEVVTGSVESGRHRAQIAGSIDSGQLGLGWTDMHRRSLVLAAEAAGEAHLVGQRLCGVSGGCSLRSGLA